MATTTKFWTLAQIKAKIQRDLAIEEETFIDDGAAGDDGELVDYINEGIDICEAEIHTIYEDYFLTKATLTLVNGADEIDLPTDIYAHKIRHIVWRNGADVYPIQRVRDWSKFIHYDLERVSSSSTTYTYFILNTTPGSPKILLSPPAQVNDSTSATIWYLRQANRLSATTDVCDIPEFVYFVIQYVKTRIYEKEGHPMTGKAVQDLAELKEQMVETLTTMVPDDDTSIEPDYSNYYDQTGWE